LIKTKYGSASTRHAPLTSRNTKGISTGPNCPTYVDASGTEESFNDLLGLRELDR
jgi:hypothetical protein